MTKAMWLNYQQQQQQRRSQRNSLSLSHPHTFNGELQPHCVSQYKTRTGQGIGHSVRGRSRNSLFIVPMVSIPPRMQRTICLPCPGMGNNDAGPIGEAVEFSADNSVTKLC
eukprot:scpid91106/ scgid24304/ 